MPVFLRCSSAGVLFDGFGLAQAAAVVDAGDGAFLAVAGEVVSPFEWAAATTVLAGVVLMLLPGRAARRQA